MTSPAERLAAHRLPGARVGAVTDGPVADGAWHALTAAAAAHGLDGLLTDAAGRGAIPATDDQRMWCVAHQIEVMSGCLALESALLDALDAVAGTSDVLAVHGIPAARLDYPDPGLRPFGDIDLLVHADELAPCVAALERRGFHRAPRSDTGRSTRLLDEPGRRIELHSHLLPPALRTSIPAAELWRGATTIDLAGRPVPIPAADIRLVVAALRAGATGSARLIVQRDLIQQVLVGQSPTDDVIATAERWQVDELLAAAVDESWRRFELADRVALSVWSSHQRLATSLPGARAAPGRGWRARPPWQRVGQGLAARRSELRR